ncbi:MAG: hypothetical protein ABI981_11275, partial [Betaproteobacteria bacterium]
AKVVVTGNGGAGIAGRAVRFDVVSGAFFILSNNPAQPLVSTLTVTSDSTGTATVTLQAAVNAPTQPAQLRATDVTSGNTVTGAFTIVQVTDGSAILSVVPETATITGANTASCSANFRIDYYIYGGTPPYRVASTFPSAVTLINSVVTQSGGFFTAVTNGTCVNPLVFTIVDAVGRQTTAQLVNAPGTTAPPAPPPPPTPTALVVSSSTLSVPTGCTAATTFSFAVTGGTAPYNFSAVTDGPGVPIYNPPTQQLSAPGGFTIKGIKPVNATTPSTTFVTVVDSSSPQMSKVLTITCGQ